MFISFDALAACGGGADGHAACIYTVSQKKRDHVFDDTLN